MHHAIHVLDAPATL